MILIPFIGSNRGKKLWQFHMKKCINFSFPLITYTQNKWNSPGWFGQFLSACSPFGLSTLPTFVSPSRYSQKYFCDENSPLPLYIRGLSFNDNSPIYGVTGHVLKFFSSVVSKFRAKCLLGSSFIKYFWAPSTYWFCTSSLRYSHE